jgi:hypothetical protein
MRRRIRCGGSLQEQFRDGRVFLTFPGLEGVGRSKRRATFSTVQSGAVCESGAVFYGLGC